MLSSGLKIRNKEDKLGISITEIIYLNKRNLLNKNTMADEYVSELYFSIKESLWDTENSLGSIIG